MTLKNYLENNNDESFFEAYFFFSAININNSSGLILYFEFNYWPYLLFHVKKVFCYHFSMKQKMTNQIVYI